MSLAWKLFLALLLVSLIGVGTMAVITLQRAQVEVRGLMMRGGINGLDSLAQELAGYYRGRGSWEGVADVLPSLISRHTDPVHFPGFGRRGGMMGIAEIMLATAAGEIIVGPPNRLGASMQDVELETATPITLENDIVGYLSDPARMFSTPATELTDRITRSFLLAGGLAMLAALLVGGMLLIGILRPVRELTSAAQAVAQGDWDQRVQVHTGDELGELSQAFNLMAESLQALEQRRRETSADIAHELRTPLSVIQARLEAILDGVHPASEGHLKAILSQTHLMNRLVEDLNTLSMADSGVLSLIKTRTDLAYTAQKVLHSFGTAAERQGVALLGEGMDQPLETQVDAARIEQILGNLISNALRHTPSGGRITLRLEEIPERRQVLIEVEDTGEGIPEFAHERIFERFYRIDESRSRGQGGSGLGLAVARKLVQAHGGRIWVEPGSDGGACFRIEIPRLGNSDGEVSGTAGA
jgi:two-component system OmpR family sensor kinase/two-component system sensor histidine kinase BaeS